MSRQICWVHTVTEDHCRSNITFHFLFTFHYNCSDILHRFQDYSNLLTKNGEFKCVDVSALCRPTLVQCGELLGLIQSLVKLLRHVLLIALLQSGKRYVSSDYFVARTVVWLSINECYYVLCWCYLALCSSPRTLIPAIFVQIGDNLE